ncbi:MAG: DNA polymerase IV [Leptospiraceae bacterium]|nr:DNA polymerase IV [Leptospiraceae bacterium]
MKTGSRRIVHFDMDAFYASIEENLDPEIRKYPVIIGSDPRNGRGRGVVSTCNYKARAFGIHSAMPISVAWRKCPQAVYLRPRLATYQQVSMQIMELLNQFAPKIEPVSVDEAYLDCSGTHLLYPDDLNLARSIQDKILSQTGLHASVGVASNKFVAKIASELNKPAGLCVCPFGQERSFLEPLPLNRLWGLGKKNVAALNQAGFFRIGQLASAPLSDLRSVLKNRAPLIRELARGRDDRPVLSHWAQKSFSEEQTYDHDTTDLAVITKTLSHLSEQLGYRIRCKGLHFRTVRLKVRFADFRTHTRAFTLSASSNQTAAIRQAALDLLIRFWQQQNQGGQPVRLIGIALDNTSDASAGIQKELFPSNSFADIRNISLDKLFDEINTQFPGKAHVASTL